METETKIKLRQLSSFDGEEYYELLPNIGRDENDFTNPVHDMSFEEFKIWLKQQDDGSKGDNLPDGYVPNKIEEYLTSEFGADYMQLPPPSMRIRHYAKEFVEIE